MGLCVVIDNSNLNNTFNFDNYYMYNNGDFEDDYEALINYYGSDVSDSESGIINITDSFFDFMHNTLNINRIYNKTFPFFWEQFEKNSIKYSDLKNSKINQDSSELCSTTLAGVGRSISNF